MRHCGVGLDAILVSNSTTHCVAQRIAPTSALSNEPSRGDIAQYWLADIVDGNGVATGGTYKTWKFLEWIFQLADGRLMSWSIPCPFFINQLDAPFQEFDELTYNSDPNSRTLGKVTPAGTATSWMPQTTHGVQSNFRGGIVLIQYFGILSGRTKVTRKSSPLCRMMSLITLSEQMYVHMI